MLLLSYPVSNLLRISSILTFHRLAPIVAPIAAAAEAEAEVATTTTAIVVLVCHC